MLNEAIFEAVCAEFHDNYFEDEWATVPEGSITKAMTRNAMMKALLKLWGLRPNTLSNDAITEK